jgi:cell division protein FtsI (penicillin-binding protein 3)
VARVAAALLGTNELQLAHALQPRLRTNALGEVLIDGSGRPMTNRYVTLRRKVPDEEWQLIRRAFTNATFGLGPDRKRDIGLLRRSIYVASEEDEIRVYPNRSLAGSVLGFTDADGHGLEGMEAFLNEQLQGIDGRIDTERTRKGGELRRFRELVIEPEHGKHIVLTLEARLQLICEEELEAAVKQFQAKGGCVVAVQPATGRVLAMASHPSYDPNRPPLDSDNPAIRRNWAVSHTFEPGSTFKLVAATAALDQRCVELTDVVDCGERGRWVGQIGNETIQLRDSHVMKERYSPVQRVIAESSNIGTFQLTQMLGKSRYADYLFRFGFGQRTGIRLPLEERGILQATNRWTWTDLSRIGMGYTVSVTPLQLTMAMSALANGGILMRPQIIDRIVNHEGELLARPEPEAVRRVCRPETAAKVRRALREVVEDGTGSLVKMERYSVAGKTGTARIAPYREERYHSSFVGFFPAESPELCIAVVVEDPNPRLGYYGGKVAGPAFRNIAWRAADYLGIQPDLPRGDDETADDRVRPGLTAVRNRH